mmetsp:Transcript_58384/g.121965  ORF Transcript_58384/g.121965 Transcript_58384/m.121965 type:complete len:243 (-) Transcript_58384:1103-1831(-)
MDGSHRQNHRRCLLLEQKHGRDHSSRRGEADRHAQDCAAGGRNGDGSVNRAGGSLDRRHTPDLWRRLLLEPGNWGDHRRGRAQAGRHAPRAGGAAVLGAEGGHGDRQPGPVGRGAHRRLHHRRRCHARDIRLSLLPPTPEADCRKQPAAPLRRKRNRRPQPIKHGITLRWTIIAPGRLDATKIRHAARDLSAFTRKHCTSAIARLQSAASAAGSRGRRSGLRLPGDPTLPQSARARPRITMH